MKGIKWAMAVAAVVFAVGLGAEVAGAETYISDGTTIIRGQNGGPYKISRDGGKTWAPYVLRVPPKRLPPVPAAKGQKCDFYECGNRHVYAVPAGTPPPAGLRPVGSGVIDGRAVDPKTNRIDRMR